jgi:hypothetical protein
MAKAKTPTAGKTSRSTAKEAPAKKRVYFRQSDFPLTSLQQAQKIASALADNFGVKDGSPPDIALSIGVSPTSSQWPPLAGSSIAYGLAVNGLRWPEVRSPMA